MNTQHIMQIAKELGIPPTQVETTGTLLAEGATVPFLARYRKEMTGSLDEVQITLIRERIKLLEQLDERKKAVLKSLEQNGHLTPELQEKVETAETLSILEDIYLPFRPKRKTRATVAKEKGLEPLARTIFSQQGNDPEVLARDFVDEEKAVSSPEEALAGARDIIAELINEDAEIRSEMRRLFEKRGIVCSRVSESKIDQGAKYSNYFDWQEPTDSAPSHRILAMRRGEKEDILNLTFAPPETEAMELLENRIITGSGDDSSQVRLALQDCYQRLLSRSMETELRLLTKEKADGTAITVFSNNLRELLLSPPLGAKKVMGIDPGFRTGCKLAILDRQGKLLHHDTINPHAASDMQTRSAGETLCSLSKKYDIEAIAIGNGTAGRETEAFVKNLPLSPEIVVCMVNESGASIYSASEAAREEFPDLDLTIRGAVSIGRRLMDPLAELVKIDPKSIGVGQYQHDVDPTSLQQALDDVVVSCVNSVGVDLNRASVQLLTYVSGLGPKLAQNIVAYRNENGPFRCRENLKKVPRLGPKAFEQAAGFLRIMDGIHPLDNSAVHPESYPIVDAMAKDLDCTLEDLIRNETLRRKIQLSRYVDERIGLPTLTDILSELVKPGRDPRKQFETFSFSKEVNEIGDLKVGMRLPGIITNVTAFGAFVDVGVHQDGLVHISQLADGFVKDPAKVVKVHQRVKVRVIAIDIEQKRISLSMKSAPENGNRPVRKPRSKKIRKPAPPEKQPFHNPFFDLLKTGK